MKLDITTLLDVLGLLLVAAGLGWLVEGFAGWGPALVTTGVVLLAGSWISGYLRGRGEET